MNFDKYIIGNAYKTRFFAYDELAQKSVACYTDNLKGLQFFDEDEANDLLENTRYTNFYIVYNLRYKYKVSCSLEV